MGEYVLKTKDGEVVKKISASCLDDANDYFALMKKLGKEELLKIFVVELIS